MIDLEEYNIFENIKAIFFDFDGTLVDFETNSIKALNAIVDEIHNYLKEEFNKEIDKEELKNLIFKISYKLDEEGVVDRNYWWSEIFKNLNIDVEREILYELSSLYWSIASENIPYEDSLETLRYLKSKGLKLGIITNSDGEGGNKRKRIEKFPLYDYFDIIIISGEAGIKPKPHREPFILACEKLNFQVRECVMIGDDPIKDCLAAKKAGLVSVLVDRKGKVKFAELYADLVIKSLTELQEFF